MADQRLEAGVSVRSADAQVTVPLQRRASWVVTAPHEVPRGIAPEPQPWGITHVRQDKGRMTACGLSTLAWRTFWNLEFAPYGKESCPACARAFARGL